jgi:hypothetical protein
MIFENICKCSRKIWSNLSPKTAFKLIFCVSHCLFSLQVDSKISSAFHSRNLVKPFHCMAVSLECKSETSLSIVLVQCLRGPQVLLVQHRNTCVSKA